MRQVVAGSGYAHMDLWNLFLAYRLAIARRIDEGSMSEEKAELKMAELTGRLSNEKRRRRYLEEQAYNQRLESMGAYLEGLGVWLEGRAALKESQKPPPPQVIGGGTITCYQYGNMIRCN